MMRTLVAMALAGLVLVACGTGREPAAVTAEGSPRTTVSPAPTPRHCDSDGGVTDLDQEPDYSARARLHRWADTEDCAVRLDVLMTRENSCVRPALDLVMGTPLGASHRVSEVRTFIKDAEHVISERDYHERLDLDADLPDDARDTGYRQGDVELWMRPNDNPYAYIVHPDHVEAWPYAESPPGCA